MVNKTGVTIKQFSEEIGAKPDRLLIQFKEAGIDIKSVDDLINEVQKQKLLQYFQQHHDANQKAAAAAPSKIVLRRAKTSEIKVGGAHHSSGKTVSIQVRKKRTYMKQAEEAEVAEAPQPVSQSTDEAPAAPETVSSTPALLTTPVLPEDAVVENAAATVAVAAVKPAEVKAGVGVKRKEKLTAGEEESEAGRHKKKKKVRDTTNESDRGFASLLARGVDLKRVMTQAEEESDDLALRKAQKIRAGHLAKIKVQAFVKPTARIVREVDIPEMITVPELAARLSMKATEIIRLLMKMGVMATINQALDQDTALLVVEEAGHRGKSVSDNVLEETLAQSLSTTAIPVPRPPVVTIMGHVDHGKTTLLDYIRTTKVAAGEAGGITQHIGAYHVQIPKGTITFLDTPGHAAFTAMRARGAKLTDIVILVVAADDGVMPQTIEAILHAQAAKVPIIVAVNKMDKPGVDPTRIKQELTKYGMVPEEWGGETMFLPISAKEGTGIDQLLDSILVQAEILELKAVTDCPAQGVVIESRLDKKRGMVMSVLVHRGTLRQGDLLLVGSEYGRVRVLYDENGLPVQSAGPAIPVEVLGLSGLAQAGDDFVVMLDEKKAREIALHREVKARANKLIRQTLKPEDAFKQIDADSKTQATINLIIKADVAGSAEALKQALLELSDEIVTIHVIVTSVGGINESDVNLAIASHAIIVAFNVRASSEARKLIEAHQVIVHYHNIIYDVLDQIKKVKRGSLAPEIREKILGIAEVRDVFRSSKSGAIAGCMVLEGTIKRNAPVRILRDQVVIFESTLESLRRFKDDVAEVRAGMECGLAVKNYNDIKSGDRLEVFERVTVQPE